MFTDIYFCFQIRRRRLEKLSGRASSTSNEKSGASVTPSSSPSTTTPPTQSQAAESGPRPKINITSSSAPAKDQEENPFMKLGAGSSASSSSIRITPSADSGSKRSRGESDSLTSTPPSRKATTAPREETADEFESRTLGSIFRVTLEEGRQVDLSGHKLTFLSGVRQELEESGEAIRLSVSNLDSAILEAASKIPHEKPVLDYLLPCWKRTVRALKNLRGYASTRDLLLKEARRLCMSNCIFAVTMPELFGFVPLATRLTVMAN